MSPTPPALHVLFTHEQMVQSRLCNKVVIVLDVLFATSTLVHMIAEGAADVRLASDAADAHRLTADTDAPLLAGEMQLRSIAGFAPPTPLALAALGVKGRNLIYTSTNGTVALLRASSAAQIYAASLLNGAAVARHVVAMHSQMTVLLVCAGSGGYFNLEDSYAAGHLVAHLCALGRYNCSDAAVAALHMREGREAWDVLSASRTGRMMDARGLSAEVAFAACLDEVDVVPALHEGQRLRSVG